MALYSLVSTVEALVMAGITDPYEFYEYIHVSEIANTSGAGMGGARSLQRMFKNRFLDQPVQNDILQETFINTVPAWINLLLLSGAGPIKTPVGACATAVESVELAVDSIKSGKAKVCIVGGYDDLIEEGSYEFANMKATSSAVEESARGREPDEMSRPATSTRAGFMEAQGAGMEILMSADLAIKMGVPIYGIVALTNTAMDKEGRSVPAPGQGILTTARETPSARKLPVLDLKYRARKLALRRKQIKEWLEHEYSALNEELDQMKQDPEWNLQDEQEWLQERMLELEREAKQQEKEALAVWGADFYLNDPRIAPLRGALAGFGLTVDAIQFASFHGTGTKANDKNESEVLHKQMAHLGRSKGHPIPSIFQKYLTGHPKGAAAAWMLNGALQVLETGIIPGNRNADNIAAELRQYEYILYPSRSIHTDGVKAGLLKSFGFGQVGGEVLLIHPDYIFATLDEHTYTQYCKRNHARQAKAYRYWHDAITGAKPLVQLKDAPPFTAAQESQVYLNPLARATYDKVKQTWSMASESVHSRLSVDKDALHVTRQVLTTITHEHEWTGVGVGVDVELCSSIAMDNATFMERNFTAKERAYCASKPDPLASFAGRWSAKEAVVKALCSLDTSTAWTKGAGAPLADIEVLASASQAPVVTLHGEAKRVADAVGVSEVKVTISHAGSYAVAVAIAK